jgi:hypothetical protein
MPEKSIYKQIQLRQSQMEEVRRYYEDGTWIDITRFINPRRKDITVDSSTNNKGRNLGTDVYDGSPLGALNTWADGTQGLLLSGRWFKSQMSDPLLNKIDRVREWLQIYDQKMYSAFNTGNFNAVTPQWLRDAGSLGTATLFTQEDVGTGKISHTAVHPREVFIAENMFGEVDTVHRKFMKTARAAVQEFSKDNVSESIKVDAEERPDKEHEFIHAVFPNADRTFGKKNSKNKEFRSVYMETSSDNKGEDGQINRDSGFDINPYAVWRFRKNSDEIYGRSPGSDALTEVLGLNQMGKSLIEAGHLAVKPAMNIPIEMRGKVRLGPDGKNYYTDKGKVITPINNGGQYPIGIDQQDRLQASMEDKYGVKFFRAFIGRTGEATAEEILAIKSEQAGLLIGQVDMLYTEGIRKIFAVVSFILDRNGAFNEENGMPPMPPEIAESGGTIDFLLTGPLAQAQRRILELEPINNTLDALAEKAAVWGPEFLDVINKDETAEAMAESGSLPQKMINSKEVREGIRAARAAAAEQAQQQQLAIEAAKVAPGLGKAPEPGSPAEAIGAAL